METKEMLTGLDDEEMDEARPVRCSPTYFYNNKYWSIKLVTAMVWSF